MVANKKNELIIKHLEYLTKHHGYTRKAIAARIGVPNARLTTVKHAKKYDVELEKALNNEFPQLQQIQQDKGEETSKKQLLNAYIDRLVDECGYTKRHIAQVVGVPAHKISNAKHAKTLDHKLLSSLIASFHELQLPTADKSKKDNYKDHIAYAEQQYQDIINNPGVAQNMGKQLEELTRQIEIMRKLLEELKENK